MKFKWNLFEIFIFCIFLVNISKVNANCLCGAIGEDYCKVEKCKTLYPVPKPPILPPVAPPLLPPTGDRCSCGKKLVQPAVLPCTCGLDKDIPLPDLDFLLPFTFCSSCEETKKSSVCNCCKQNKELAKVKFIPPNPCQMGPWIHTDALLQKKCGIPADPVSISLAYKSLKTHFLPVPEDKVQYGPKVPPLIPIKNLFFKNIPEEKLFALNKQIIELKKKGFPKKCEDDLIEDDSEEDCGIKPKFLTYGELGYRLAKFPIPKFKTLLPHPGLPFLPDCLLSSLKDDCDVKGFKPGAIVPLNLIEPVYKSNHCLREL